MVLQMTEVYIWDDYMFFLVPQRGLYNRQKTRSYVLNVVSFESFYRGNLQTRLCKIKNLPLKSSEDGSGRLGTKSNY